MILYKRIKLLAPISANYGDKFARFLIVRDIHKYVQNLLKKGAKIINATKVANVEYVICTDEVMQVDTFAMAEVNGNLYKIHEATNIAQKGDFIILKNGNLPRQYRMSMNTAKQRYDFNEHKTKGVAKPIEKPQQFIKINRNIAFVAPWGSMMYLAKGGYLNITTPHIYAIQNYSFEHTYNVVQDDGKTA
ncbi:MAG: hypothetical protein IJU58_01805 [Clostridia bacterium]|nr:hypothetical protein [Clostridia bacterium]